jgi:hypothetical protein
VRGLTKEAGVNQRPQKTPARIGFEVPQTLRLTLGQ